MDCCNSVSGSKGQPPKNYVRNGKIMLCSVLVLVLVSVFIVVFFIHNGSRCFSLRRRRRRRQQRQIRRQRLAHRLVFSSDNFTAAADGLENQGLEFSVLKSLPVFIYRSKTGDPPPECAVCLSEFEDDERGRLLPKCGHRFHHECIDMWFQSHTNCPLCRSPVLLHISEPEKSDIEPGGSGSEMDLESGVSETGRSLSLPQKNTSAHCLRELEDIVAEVERRERGLSSAGDPDSTKNSGNRVLNPKKVWSI
ncbi:RING-H2 finger protein ATL5 [Tripterygium wilfordii]|uniref:RING-type E3 ubiquitin transferase n=1 Tax=Tripterygium wilfordii TaxID=458696 RepID=A0A7J7DCQ4_TRIWF|nr:RING-H2 finger protein ATL64-like [Tripterygium wilfordii]KAF5744127.1 RING-H2 finger protein ATL5 [Tripterygium wilfordii]